MSKRSKRITRRKQSKRSRTLRKRSKRGGSITTPMIGSLEGEEHKGLNRIVVAGPMGVMSGSAYLQAMADLDQQGAE
jgi:hypothetical protein